MPDPPSKTPRSTPNAESSMSRVGTARRGYGWRKMIIYIPVPLSKRFEQHCLAHGLEIETTIETLIAQLVETEK